MNDSVCTMLIEAAGFSETPSTHLADYRASSLSVVGLYRSQVQVCADGTSEDNTYVHLFQVVNLVFKWLCDYASYMVQPL